MNHSIEYRGYTGSVEFSPEDALFYGKVMGVRAGRIFRTYLNDKSRKNPRPKKASDFSFCRFQKKKK